MQIVELIKNLEELIDRFDKLDILILRKFYFSGREFPNDLQLYSLPILIKELRELHRVNLTDDAIRKRVNKLCKLGLLKKVENSNPSIFLPIEDLKPKIKTLIEKYISYIGIENLI